MNKVSDNNLIKSTIKGLEVTCYVVTEDQLENQQRESIFSDIFLLIASLLLGSAISNVFPVYVYLLLLLGVLMLLLSVWNKYLKYDLIKKLKKSPEVKYIDFEGGGSIEIIKATYGSDTQNMDVTESMRSKIINNKIDMLVLNKEFDHDPHVGVNKILEVIYKQNEKIITKKCNEYERITMP